MRPLNLHRRRGAQMLEFVLLLPLTLGVVLFSIDMGRIILLSGQVQDAANVAARTGAQLGGACVNPTTGAASPSCTNTGPAADSFFNTLEQGIGSTEGATITVDSGGICRMLGQPDSHVTVTAQHPVNLIFPGFQQLLNLTESDDQWVISATAVARCEVVRR